MARGVALRGLRGMEVPRALRRNASVRAAGLGNSGFGVGAIATLGAAGGGMY